jgi:hypothetical protein
MEIDFELDESTFNQILEKLEYIENNSLQKENINDIWIEKITHIDFKLIPFLSVFFLDNINDRKITTNILKVIR